ncbi:unnamed protein product [Lathyrus sativus]|nr:unnamed protein product [Lathyrus sativus]
MMKLKSKRFCRSISKLGNIGNKVIAPSPIEKDCSDEERAKKERAIKVMKKLSQLEFQQFLSGMIFPLKPLQLLEN